MTSDVTQANGGASDAYIGAPVPQSKAIDKNAFLQLLVAQMKNQDPMNPSDGTQFLTQLAQFQQLEQGINTGQDVAAIRKDLDQLAGNTQNDSSAAKTQS
jgi:flagellar basal-body rod modification protein FlgD